MKQKTMQVMMTEQDYAIVAHAAKQAGKSISQFGADLILGAISSGRKKNPEVLEAVENFRRLFAEAMELNLKGELTVARFRGLAERRSFQ